MNPTLKSALMIAGGAGVGAAGTATINSHLKNKALVNQAGGFRDYNSAENKAIAEHAFRAGAAYAMEQTKTAAVNPLIIKGVLGGLRTAVNVIRKKGLSAGYRSLTPHMRRKALTDVGRVGIGAAGAAGLGSMAFGGSDDINNNIIVKQSALIKQAAFNKVIKDVFYGGLKSASKSFSKGNTMSAGWNNITRTQKKDAIKNLLMIGSGATAVAGGIKAIKN
jgi:hypothetical protein